MRGKTYYTEAFRQQALEKVYTRGSRTVKAVAKELNINPWTLKNWMRLPEESSIRKEAVSAKRPKDWSRAERLKLLLDSHGLDDEALNAFCRERGIFRHHLEQWQVAFESDTSVISSPDRAELHELKETNKALVRELRRKEKALAEAAALLVLQKKYQALWEDKDD